MSNIDLPKKYENIPELNDKLNPSDGSLWNMLKLHRTENRVVIYNPLASVQFDIDISEMPQLKAGKVGIVRWDKLAHYLYANSSLWYILAQLNNITDPITELPDRSDLIYYIDPDVIDNVFRQIRNS